MYHLASRTLFASNHIVLVADDDRKRTAESAASPVRAMASGAGGGALHRSPLLEGTLELAAPSLASISKSNDWNVLQAAELAGKSC